MKRAGMVWLLLFFLGTVLAAGWFVTPDNYWAKDPVTWQKMTMPGALSAAHGDLGNDCKACHTAISGAERNNCVACHGNDQRLLIWPEMIFHASVASCGGCHVEHRGRDAAITAMDHDRLARLDVISDLKSEQADNSQVDRKAAVKLLNLEHPPGSPAQPLTRLLNCASCHANKDKHEDLFGRDCIQCHDTERWSIAAFRHPLDQSTDCAECHLPPKDHFRGAFKAMCAARIDQCYMCHSLPAWTDITPGAGWRGVRAKCR